MTPQVHTLVVDDEEGVRFFLEETLRRAGHVVVTASSGEEALEAMKKKSFDVVILDVKMPGGMDGIETLREMKKIQPLTEVILLTGHASVETSIEGMKLGAFDYVLKPVKLEDLLAKVADAIQKKDTHESKIRGAQINKLLRYW